MGCGKRAAFSNRLAMTRYGPSGPPDWQVEGMAFGHSAHKGIERTRKKVAAAAIRKRLESGEEQVNEGPRV
jgi:hypothetical protein